MTRWHSPSRCGRTSPFAKRRRGAYGGAAGPWVSHARGELAVRRDGVTDPKGMAHVCLFGVPWSSTKPRRLAGLRCLREIPLPEAHDEIALTLGRLLPPRVHLIGRVWDAGEESVANRLDELRRNANVRRLLVVVSKAKQLRFAPAAADKGDPQRQSRVVAGGHRDVGVTRHRSRSRRAHEELEVAVEVALTRVVVRRPGRTVRQGDDRVEVVGGHELVDSGLNGRRRRLP